MDAAMKKVKALEGGKPLGKAELTAAVEKIKKEHKVAITVKEQGTDTFILTLNAKGKGSKQPAKVKRKKGDDKQPQNADPKKQKKLDEGIKAIKDEDKKIAGDGKLKQDEAEKVAKNVKSAHSDIFKSITAVDGGENWKYNYIQKSDSGSVTGSKEEKAKLPDEYVVGTLINASGVIWKITTMSKDSVEFLNMENETVRMLKKMDNVIKLIVDDKKWVKATAQDIKDLEDRTFPEERKLPPAVNGEVIRDHYEGFGWTAHSKSLRTTGEPIIIAEVNRVKALTDKKKQADEWKILKAKGWVKKDGAAATYDPSVQEYHVDHDPDLAIRWNSMGGRDKDDNYRGKQLIGPSLNVVEKIWNLSKPKIKYVLSVGRGFSSAKLNSPLKSKTIMGQRYLDKNNKPLK
jgi:hypothetical protein